MATRKTAQTEDGHYMILAGNSGSHVMLEGHGHFQGPRISVPSLRKKLRGERPALGQWKNGPHGKEEPPSHLVTAEALTRFAH